MERINSQYFTEGVCLHLGPQNRETSGEDRPAITQIFEGALSVNPIAKGEKSFVFHAVTRDATKREIRSRLAKRSLQATPQSRVMQTHQERLSGCLKFLPTRRQVEQKGRGFRRTCTTHKAFAVCVSYLWLRLLRAGRCYSFNWFLLVRY